ncbi:MAG: sulfite exporter TauE/SafE family protein [Pseudomonadota bacterium]
MALEWLTPEIIALAVTAGTIGILHTAIGPDHYLPFVVLGRARQWSARRTALTTLACGAIHVVGSVLLGVVGVAAGLALRRLEWIEGVRGDLAAWGLLAFGLVYLVWALKRGQRAHVHSHPHVHADGSVHTHVHDHSQEHLHLHERDHQSLVPWTLFVVFAFGPCEALIPLLMYPAAAASIPGAVFVTAVFALATLTTMLTLVMFGYWGITRFAGGQKTVSFMTRHAHAFAGAAIALCATLMLAGL